MNIKTIKQNTFTALALGATITLGACSSNPSPWSQQASPWDNRQAATEEQPYLEPAVAEPIEPVEPVGVAVVESEAVVEEPVYAESGAMVEAEPMAEPEPVTMEAEPVAAADGDIMSQPASHYAVQVVASSSMEGLMNFCKQHDLSDDWTAETSVNGKTWYVLLLGVYPSMTEAKEGLTTVQGHLDTQPWIRNVGSLQAVVMQ